MIAPGGREFFLGVLWTADTVWARFFTTHPTHGLATWDTFHYREPVQPRTEQDWMGTLWVASVQGLERYSSTL